MATVYRCDRCRSEHVRHDNIRTIQFPKVEYNGKNFKPDLDDKESDYESVDLCASCVQIVRGTAKPLTDVREAKSVT